jgi:ribosomal protein S1
MTHESLIHDDGDNVGVTVVSIERERKVMGLGIKSARPIAVRARDEIVLGHKIALMP